MELEQLRKKYAETEYRNSQEIMRVSVLEQSGVYSLNINFKLKKDANELETIIEHKIFQEVHNKSYFLWYKLTFALKDAYTEKIKELEDKLARYSSSKKSSSSSKSSTTPAPTISHAVTGQVCDLCEQPGHEIQDCPVLKTGSSDNYDAGNGGSNSELFCEDCEGRGHIAANCPHSMDVF